MVQNPRGGGNGSAAHVLVDAGTVRKLVQHAGELKQLAPQAAPPGSVRDVMQAAHGSEYAGAAHRRVRTRRLRPSTPKGHR